MASLHSPQPHLLLLPSPFPTRTRSPAFLPSQRTHFAPLGRYPLPVFRGNSVVARFGPGLGFSDLESAEFWARELFTRAEAAVYTIADAAVTSSASDAAEALKQRDWLSGITDYLEGVLKVLKDGLSALHIPYAYGFAIILLTVLVKAATFPLSKKQVESAMAMRSLQPQVKAIQERYAGDQEKIQLETARLYKLAGVNPLAGCLPTLATIPVWIGLYRALSNVTNEGLLTEGFFWIPSLAGPTTVAARQSGSGISWLFPFVDGHPPLGWSDTLAYLVLPVLLVLSQYISAQIMQPSQGTDPNQKSAQAVTKFLPLMIGYFALSVPSGLSLYWFTNNVLSTAQQIWLQKLGGAKDPVKQYNDKMTKEVLPQIQKSTLEVESNNVKSSQQVVSESTGLHPGERFRQIKEQEVRRKQEREEQRRRAEIAAEVSHVNKIEQNLGSEQVESKKPAEDAVAKMIEEGSQSATAIPASLNVDIIRVNGSHSKQDLGQESDVDLSNTKNGVPNYNGDATVEDEQSAHEVTGKASISTNASYEHDAVDQSRESTEGYDN